MAPRQHLETGVYAPSNAKRVTVWPAPDKDGDGPELWEDNHDGQGNFVGRSAVKDRDGNPVREYSAPDGFINLPIRDPGGDGQRECWVRADERGQVWRHPKTGHAAEIRPGTTLVEHPNGDFELLTDEYQQYLFAKSHERVADDKAPDLPEPEDAEERAKTEQEARDRAEFEDWKRQRDAAARDVVPEDEDVTPPAPGEDTPGESGEATLSTTSRRGRK